MQLQSFRTVALATLFTLTALVTANAAPLPIGVDVFESATGATLVTFEGIPEFTEANGLTVGSLTFEYAGPAGSAFIGPTLESDNIAGESLAISAFGAPEALSIHFSSAVIAFGTGFAFSTQDAVADALTIEIFDGLTSLGTLSFNANPDPSLIGGFAGLRNDVAFDRVVLTFDDPNALLIALDNLRTIPAPSTPIPEPATLSLLGLAVVAVRHRRRV